MSDTKRGPAVLAWSAWKDGQGTLDMKDILCGMESADAAIAELEADHASVAKAYNERYSELVKARATIERLMTCGNCRTCGWVIQPEAFLTLRCAHDDHAVELHDHCQLTPTKWEQP